MARSPESPSVTRLLRCPRCGGALDLDADTISCQRCAARYPRLDRIPILLPDPQRYIASCWTQLAGLQAQTDAAVREIEEQLRAPDVTSQTRARCFAVIDAIVGQAADVRAILEPMLPRVAVSPDSADELAQVPAPLHYIHYLFRDWGWPAEPDGENERALAAVNAIRGNRSLGHMLVLGAGACRLALDLHREDPSAETLALDIDPLLLGVADAVIRGATVSVREANAEIDDASRVSRLWSLQNPHGPVRDSRFHCLLANGLEPPVEPGVFDTVVTPWFIDVVPTDLREFLSTAHRLLKPGGVWLSLGPLRYPSHLQSTLRFARDEVFDLARRAGFFVERWRAESVPYLVSKLNGRGKVESVLAFAAKKTEAVTDGGAEEDPPSWLLFRHLPIPRFPGQAVFPAKTPVEEIVVAAIDGDRTVEDIAALVASRLGGSRITLGEIREGVRACLAEVHPGVRR